MLCSGCINAPKGGNNARPSHSNSFFKDYHIPTVHKMRCQVNCKGGETGLGV